jgi:poly(3-hydroxybutyrate) depolymerase
MGAADGGGGGAGVAGAGNSASPGLGSPGCGAEPPASDTTIQVAGQSASYIVELPANYEKARPYPLVLAFAGANVTAEQFRGQLDLPQAAGANAIVVYLNCLGDASSWNVQRDVPLFDALLAQTSARYCVDQRRVYAAGDGIGGYFASALGCLRGDKLRAVAAVAPGVPPSYTCQGEVAVWIAQGAADTPISLANGRNTRDFWATKNACDTTMTAAVEPSPCVEFTGCHPGFAVRYCEYVATPGLPSFAASAMWRFFATF